MWLVMYPLLTTSCLNPNKMTPLEGAKKSVICKKKCLHNLVLENGAIICVILSNNGCRVFFFLMP